MSNQLPVPFTPGPWAVESDTDIVSNSGDFVASCHEPESGVGTAREYANARLIAAAPELLAALQAIMDDPDAVDHILHLDAVAADAAIAKATGGDL